MLRRAVLVLALLLAPPLAHAEDRSAGGRAAEAAIRARLAAWTEAFNRGDAAATCDLFADDLKSDVQGASAGDKAAVCARLAKAPANSESCLLAQREERWGALLEVLVAHAGGPF